MNLYVILVVGCAICAILYYATNNKETVTPTEIPCGRYINTDKMSNPYKTEYDYVTVLESKDGWVKYAMGKTSTYSLTVGTFLDIYTRLPLEESP